MIEGNLQDEIFAFVHETFSPEKADDYLNAFALFDAFEYNGAYRELPSILYQGSDVDKDQVVSHFDYEVLTGVNFILKSHGIKMMEEAPLEARIEVAGCLYRVQAFEDSTPLLNILDSQEFTAEEKVARVFEVLTSKEFIYFFQYFEEVKEELVVSLKQLLSTKEQEEVEDDDKDPKVKALFTETLKWVFEFFGTDNLGGLLIEGGVKPGFQFETYLPYVQKHLTVVEGSSLDEIAMDFYTLLMMTYEGQQSPIIEYRKHSDILVDLKAMSEIERKITELDSRFTNFKKAKYEEKRIS